MSITRRTLVAGLGALALNALAPTVAEASIPQPLGTLTIRRSKSGRWSHTFVTVGDKQAPRVRVSVYGATAVYTLGFPSRGVPGVRPAYGVCSCSLTEGSAVLHATSNAQATVWD